MAIRRPVSSLNLFFRGWREDANVTQVSLCFRKMMMDGFSEGREVQKYRREECDRAKF